jgi:hypothetical protein
MKVFIRICLCVIFIYLNNPGYTQTSDTNKKNQTQEVKPNPKPKKDTIDRSVIKPNNLPNIHSRTDEENKVTIMLLVFGIIVLIIAAVIIYKFAQDVNHLFKYFIIILIIIGSILLILIGYDKDQITPAVGLFGSIAGYLLGRADTTSVPNPNAPRANQPVPPANPAGPQ